NNHPEAILFVQHVYNPGEVGSSLYTHTVSTYYSSVRHQWAVFAPDGAPFVSGTPFFVLRAGPTNIAFQHLTSSANTFGDFTVLDNPAINGNPNALILVNQNFGSGLSSGDSASPVYVRYDSEFGRWEIVNLDGASMFNGLQYNVLVVPPKTGHFLQIATTF